MIDLSGYPPPGVRTDETETGRKVRPVIPYPLIYLLQLVKKYNLIRIFGDIFI